MEPTRRGLLLAGAAVLAAAGCRLPRGAAQAAPAAAPPNHLVTRLARPYCGEAQLDRLVTSWLTPVGDFYVLDHGDEPAIAAADHVVEVTGLVRRPLRLTLRQLAALPTVTVPATLMCAGNRRLEHHARRPVSDPLLWGAGAIGNALWTGARLADVLALAGVAPGARHVWFEGLDRTAIAADRPPFGGSIPLARVADRARPPVLLATHMNRAPLTRSHGAPLRAIVPGHIGARSVKWLGRVVVSATPSDNPHFAIAHRLSPDGAAARAPLYDLPLNAAICVPGPGRTAPAGERLVVAGYAVPPGRVGGRVARVELSLDGGRSWQRAALGDAAAPACWRLWSAAVEVPREPVELVARAVDERGAPQPEHARWNHAGYLYDAWPRVALDPRA